MRWVRHRLGGLAAAVLLGTALSAGIASGASASTLPFGSCTPTSVAVNTTGAAYTLTVPAGHVYRVESFFVTLTTSGTAANRFLRARYDDGTNVLGESYSTLNGAQAASVAYAYTGLLGAPTQSNNQQSQWMVGLPDVALPAAYRFRIFVSGISGADTLVGSLWYCDSSATSYTFPVSGTVGVSGTVPVSVPNPLPVSGTFTASAADTQDAINYFSASTVGLGLIVFLLAISTVMGFVRSRRSV